MPLEQKKAEDKGSFTLGATKKPSTTSKRKQDTDISPDDLKLKETLEASIDTILDTTRSTEDKLDALRVIATEIRQSTTSMTAIPKPLKYLLSSIQPLVQYFDTLSDLEPTSELRYQIADLLSVLHMTIPKTGLVLKYRLLATPDRTAFDPEKCIVWGTAYCQYLTGEIAKEWVKLSNVTTPSPSALSSPRASISMDDSGDDTTTTPKPLNDTTATAGLSHDDSLILPTSTTSMADDTTTATTPAPDTPSSPTSTSSNTTDQSSQDDKPVTDATQEQLRLLAISLLDFLFTHGCEIDAADMLLEINALDSIVPHIDLTNFEDVLLYIENSIVYSSDPNEVISSLILLYTIYINIKQYTYALSIILRMHISPYRNYLLSHLFHNTRYDVYVQLSLAYTLSQELTSSQFLYTDEQDIYDSFTTSQGNDESLYPALLPLLSTMETFELPIVSDSTVVDVLQRGPGTSLSQQTLTDTGVTRPKQREDVCRGLDNADEPAEWIAVGLANTGTQMNDCLGESTQGAPAVLLAKGVALGSIHIGDVEDGYTHADPFLTHDSTSWAVIGGLMATGLCGVGVTNDFNAGLALLSDFALGTDGIVDESDTTTTGTDATGPKEPKGGEKGGLPFAVRQQATACLSLGINYFGTQNLEIREILTPILLDPSIHEHIRGFAALGLAFTNVGTCNEDLFGMFAATMMDITSMQIRRLICFSCGLLLLRYGFVPESIKDILENISDPNDDELIKALSISKSLNKKDNDKDITNVTPVSSTTTTGTTTGTSDDSTTTTQTNDAATLASSVVSATAGWKTLLGTIVDGFAYLGTGNMLVIQSLIAIIGTVDQADKLHDDDDDDNDNDDEPDIVDGFEKIDPVKIPPHANKNQNPSGRASPVLTTAQKKILDDHYDMSRFSRITAVIAISLISLGDDLTTTVVQRLLHHILECGSPATRQGVIPSIAILNASTPQPTITDFLIRMTHDSDHQLATMATLSIGIVAAGSNNARSLAGITEMLNDTRDATVGRIGRIAQGLCLLGQGTRTLSPSWLHGTCLHTSSLVALLFMAFQMIESQCGLLTTQLEVWGIIAACSRPKVLTTIMVPDDVRLASDTEEYPNDPRHIPTDIPDTLSPVTIPVKLGTVVGGVLGRKTVLSGVQATHSPIVVGPRHTVQVDDPDIVALHHCLEGRVLVRKVYRP